MKKSIMVIFGCFIITASSFGSSNMVVENTDRGAQENNQVVRRSIRERVVGKNEENFLLLPQEKNAQVQIVIPVHHGVQNAQAPMMNYGAVEQRRVPHLELPVDNNNLEQPDGVDHRPVTWRQFLYWLCCCCDPR
ncbi:MAG: hypothetical protein WBQ73_03915 [Candidatus Babeliales bacterium]